MVSMERGWMALFFSDKQMAEDYRASRFPSASDPGEFRTFQLIEPEIENLLKAGAK